MTSVAKAEEEENQLYRAIANPNCLRKTPRILNKESGQFQSKKRMMNRDIQTNNNYNRNNNNNNQIDDTRTDATYQVSHKRIKLSDDFQTEQKVETISNPSSFNPNPSPFTNPTPGTSPFTPPAFGAVSMSLPFNSGTVTSSTVTPQTQSQTPAAPIQQLTESALRAHNDKMEQQQQQPPQGTTEKKKKKDDDDDDLGSLNGDDSTTAVMASADTSGTQQEQEPIKDENTFTSRWASKRYEEYQKPSAPPEKYYSYNREDDGDEEEDDNRGRHHRRSRSSSSTSSSSSSSCTFTPPSSRSSSRSKHHYRHHHHSKKHDKRKLEDIVSEQIQKAHEKTLLPIVQDLSKQLQALKQGNSGGGDSDLQQQLKETQQQLLEMERSQKWKLKQQEMEYQQQLLELEKHKTQELQQELAKWKKTATITPEKNGSSTPAPPPSSSRQPKLDEKYYPRVSAQTITIEKVKDDIKGNGRNQADVSRHHAVEDVKQRLLDLQKAGEKLPPEVAEGLMELSSDQVDEIRQLKRKTFLIGREYDKDASTFHNDTTTSISIVTDVLSMFFDTIQPWGYNLQGFVSDVDDMLKEPATKEMFNKIYDSSGVGYAGNPKRTIFLRLVKLFSTNIGKQMHRKRLADVKKVQERKQQQNNNNNNNNRQQNKPPPSSSSSSAVPHPFFNNAPPSHAPPVPFSWPGSEQKKSIPPPPAPAPAPIDKTAELEQRLLHLQKQLEQKDVIAQKLISIQTEREQQHLKQVEELKRQKEKQIEDLKRQKEQTEQKAKEMHQLLEQQEQAQLITSITVEPPSPPFPPKASSSSIVTPKPTTTVPVPVTTQVRQDDLLEDPSSIVNPTGDNAILGNVVAAMENLSHRMKGNKSANQEAEQRLRDEIQEFDTATAIKLKQMQTPLWPPKSNKAF